MVVGANPMSRKVRRGLLSTVKISNALIGPLKQAAADEPAAVACRNAERVAEYARKHEIPKACASCEALLADPAIDAVCISLPNSLHAEPTVKAGQSATAEQICDFGRARLAPYKAPAPVEFRADLPKSQTGKTLRRVLVEESMANATPPAVGAQKT